MPHPSRFLRHLRSMCTCCGGCCFRGRWCAHGTESACERGVDGIVCAGPRGGSPWGSSPGLRWTHGNHESNDRGMDCCGGGFSAAILKGVLPGPRRRKLWRPEVGEFLAVTRELLRFSLVRSVGKCGPAWIIPGVVHRGVLGRPNQSLLRDAAMTAWPRASVALHRAFVQARTGSSPRRRKGFC